MADINSNLAAEAKPVSAFDLALGHYLDYRKRITSQSIAEMEDNFARNQGELREIAQQMEDAFPKDATVGNHYLMFEAYRRIELETLTPEQHRKWEMHVKKFVKECPEIRGTPALYSIIDSLPDVTDNPAVVFEYSALALKKMDPAYATYALARQKVEKAAELYYNDLGIRARMAVDDKERLKCYEKQSMVLTSLPPLKRIPLHRENIQSLAPLYQQTEAGKEEIHRRQSSQFNRVWKSLPSDVKNMYRQQAWRNR